MAASSAATGADASAAGHIPVSSRGGPGSTTTSGPPGRCTTSPGAVPTGASATAPRGTIACLRLAASSAGPANPLRFAHPARIPAMCARIVLVQLQRRARERRDDLAGEVVGRRPEPAGGDDQRGARLGGEPQRAVEVLRPVADDRDLRHLEPEPHELAGDERAVAVGDRAREQLAAGDDDGRARPLRGGHGPTLGAIAADRLTPTAAASRRVEVHPAATASSAAVADSSPIRTASPIGPCSTRQRADARRARRADRAQVPAERASRATTSRRSRP